MVVDEQLVVEQVVVLQLVAIQLDIITELSMAQRPAQLGTEPADKPDDVIDRDSLWAELSSAWRRPQPALLFGIGRRRAGKSWVLARFARAVTGIYYQATKRTETEQLAALSRIIGQHFDDAALMRGASFPRWEDLFEYLSDRARRAPLLLVLDEFPYLAEAAPALPSILQDFWDHHWQESQIKVVLNGSHITAMTRLEEADQPLYGRRTGRLQFPPFHLQHVQAFVPGYDAKDVLLTYGIFGGLPGHLALLRADEPVEANAARLILDPSGRLADDAEHMLDAFLGDADIHYSIIQAIATGEHTWKGITNRLGKSGGSLSRPLNWLEEMQFVARQVPITENPRTSRRTLYRIVDPYVAFWHRFVAPLLASGETSLTDAETLWNGRVLPSLDNYMGRPFEDACRSWVGRTTRLSFRPSRVGSWWDSTSDNEIDIVALGVERELLVGECKWGPFDDSDLTTLRTRAALLQGELPQAAQGGALTLACFSARGEWGPTVTREIEAGTILGFTAQDILTL